MTPINFKEIIEYYYDLLEGIEADYIKEISISPSQETYTFQKRRKILETIIMNRFPNHDLDDAEPIYGIVNLMHAADYLVTYRGFISKEQILRAIFIKHFSVDFLTWYNRTYEIQL